MRSDGGVITSRPRSASAEAKKQERKRKKLKTGRRLVKSGPAVREVTMSLVVDDHEPASFDLPDQTEDDEPYPVPEDPERELTGQVAYFGSPHPPAPDWEDLVPSRYDTRLLKFD